MNAWLFQDHRQKKRLGAKAPWSVGWIDPDGKKRSKRVGSKSMAEKHRRKVEGELAAGTYRPSSRMKWSDFRHEYELKELPAKATDTRRCVSGALDHFERLVKPQLARAIKTKDIDNFVAQRRLEPGKRRGDLVSPATVNKELRHLKAVLQKAVAWEYLPKMPIVTMVKEAKKLPTYVTTDHFALIYDACHAARLPKSLPYSPRDWWRALLVFNFMTGWRIGEPLALRRQDLDLDAATAITRADDNKAGRDDLIPLHPVVVDHLKRIASFEDIVFPWPHHQRSLWSEFHRIQNAAGIHLPCNGDHEHTSSCHLYGFHDLRRAFATCNAETLTADALQRLMRHESYTTTQLYINMAQQLKKSADDLFVPEVLRRAN